MPSYEYKCGKCGIQYDVERSIHAEASDPICCDMPMSRVYSVPPVRFNAGGFYSTDNPKR
jgi:putative FmdB family regulatory protein